MPAYAEVETVTVAYEVLVIAPFGVASDAEMREIIKGASTSPDMVRIVTPVGRPSSAARRAGALVVELPLDRNPLNLMRNLASVRTALRAGRPRRSLLWQGSGFIDPYLLMLSGGLAALRVPQPTLLRPGGRREPIPFRPSGVAPAAVTSAQTLGHVLALPRRLRALAIPRRATRPIRRVLYLRDDLAMLLSNEVGGSTSHTRGVVGGLLDNGVDVITATARPITVEGRPTPPVLDCAVELPRNLHSELTEAYLDRQVTARVLAQVDGAGIDMVYQRHSMFGAAGAEVAHHLRVPLVLECNASETRFRAHYGRLHFRRAAERFEAALFDTASLVVAVSRRVADEVTELAPRAQVEVIPNGVDVRLFDVDPSAAVVERRALGIPDGSMVVGFFGRFYEWHGVVTLARALAAAMATRTDVHALFVGDGPCREPAEAELSALGERAHFVGLVPHERIPSLMTMCDVLVAPHAPIEGFIGSPIKLFEYLASGRAVIASRLEQLGEVIDDGQTGVLVTPGDVDALAAAITHLAGDPGLRQRLGRSAREDALCKHSWSGKVRHVLEAVS